MSICPQCQGTGLVTNPGDSASSTTGQVGNFVDANSARGVWPLNTVPMKCPSCLGNKIQNAFGN